MSTGVKLIFDRTSITVNADFFAAALKHFAGREVKGGFKMDDPPMGGFGAWIESNSKQLNSMNLTPRHASFIAAILCHEAGVESWLKGNAVWLRFPQPDPNRVWFKQKIAELKAAVDMLPADRQDKLKKQLEEESEQ